MAEQGPHYDFHLHTERRGGLFLVSQGKDKGKGNSDGSHNFKQLFSCKQRCGLFVPFSQITPVALSSASSPPTAEPGAQPNAEELYVGDRVTYFMNSEPRHGMVMDIQERDGQTMVRISTVSSLPNHSSTVTVSARLQASSQTLRLTRLS